MRMITKEDIEKAEAELVSKQCAAYAVVAAAKAAVAAWAEYLKLEREYEDGNKSTED